MYEDIIQPSEIWLPGQGVVRLVPSYVRAAMQAVEEYDPDLSIGQHKLTGEWVVLLKRGPMQEPHPVFGLGYDLPAPEEIKKRLYKGDVRRHGGKLAVQLQKAADARLESSRREFSQASEEVAEAFEWAHRKQGTHPSPRVFMSSPKKKKGAS